MVIEDYLNIFTEFKGEESDVIPILQKIQDRYGYISAESISRISDFVKVSKNIIYGVATFYAQFRFKEPSRHTIKVCSGTACHVRGGQILSEAVQREVGVKSGEATIDNRFSLERVACLGCCASAPVVQVDDDIHARVTILKLSKILNNYS